MGTLNSCGSCTCSQLNESNHSSDRGSNLPSRGHMGTNGGPRLHFLTPTTMKPRSSSYFTGSTSQSEIWCIRPNWSARGVKMRRGAEGHCQTLWKITVPDSGPALITVPHAGIGRVASTATPQHEVTPDCGKSRRVTILRIIFSPYVSGHFTPIIKSTIAANLRPSRRHTIVSPGPKLFKEVSSENRPLKGGSFIDHSLKKLVAIAAGIGNTILMLISINPGAPSRWYTQNTPSSFSVVPDNFQP
mmetsp:Transcript_3335/g.7878  ORF Transcript_3335/g.7878 Transcript_3335/m.7878 type:complete len:245 (-) Transcript_3335:169-903(-)